MGWIARFKGSNRLKLARKYSCKRLFTKEKPLTVLKYLARLPLTCARDM